MYLMIRTLNLALLATQSPFSFLSESASVAITASKSLLMFQQVNDNIQWCVAS